MATLSQCRSCAALFTFSVVTVRRFLAVTPHLPAVLQGVACFGGPDWRMRFTEWFASQSRLSGRVCNTYVLLVISNKD